MPPASPPPTASPELLARTVARGRVLVLVALAAAGALTLAIHFDLFPLRLQLVLRDWGLHWAAALATSLFIAVLLGADTGMGAPFAARLAVWGPFTFLLLHELGQWTWPAQARDAFDSGRDVLLNAIGAGLARWLLRHGSAVARARVAAVQAARSARAAGKTRA